MPAMRSRARCARRAIVWCWFRPNPPHAIPSLRAAAQIEDVKCLGQHVLAGSAGDDLRRLDYLPGQYANLQVPGEAEQYRAYSFSSMDAARTKVCS